MELLKKPEDEILFHNGKEITLKAKTVIYRPGDIIKEDAIYYILEGRVTVARRINAKHILHENFSANDVFGIVSAYKFSNRDELAATRRDSRLYVWDKKNFETAVSMHPELARRVILCLSRRLRNMNKGMQVVNYKIDKTEDEEIFSDLNAQLNKDLFQIAFSKEDTIPEDIIQKFEVIFEKGEYLMRENERSTHLYIIIDGEVEILQNIDNKEVIIAVLNKGDILGEMAQFDNLPRSASARAITRTRTLKLTKENFNVIFLLHPRWVLKLIETLSQRVYNAFLLLKRSYRDRTPSLTKNG